MEPPLEIWELWFPNAAAQGLPFARGRLRRTERLWVHAAPDALRVEVKDDAGRQRASADQLRLAGEHRPMTLLTLAGKRVTREDRWPAGGDLGDPVILPGGEVGILRSWWNDEQGREWRWTIEFYNRRD